MAVSVALDGTSADLATAMLLRLGFESFEEKEHSLVGYINCRFWDDHLKKALDSTGFNYSVEKILDQNWNEVWESNFDPIVISKKCMIRADFHLPVDDYEFDIVINPKMSFGTGHHATTTMMVEYLLENPPEGCSVIDAGTGTGVLAILSEKLNATSIVAFDIEEGAVLNCKENCERNGCTRVKVSKGTIGDQQKLPKSDLLLVNIHKYVLIDEMGMYFERCNSGGTLVLSGFYLTDVAEIDRAAQSAGFAPVTMRSRNDWCCRVYTNPF